MRVSNCIIPPSGEGGTQSWAIEGAVEASKGRSLSLSFAGCRAEEALSVSFCARIGWRSDAGCWTWIPEFNSNHYCTTTRHMSMYLCMYASACLGVISVRVTSWMPAQHQLRRLNHTTTTTTNNNNNNNDNHNNNNNHNHNHDHNHNHYNDNVLPTGLGLDGSHSASTRSPSSRQRARAEPPGVALYLSLSLSLSLYIYIYIYVHTIVYYDNDHNNSNNMINNNDAATRRAWAPGLARARPLRAGLAGARAAARAPIIATTNSYYK